LLTALKSNPKRYDWCMPLNVQEQFGQIDSYVFDQILRGNITQEMWIWAQSGPSSAARL